MLLPFRRFKKGKVGPEDLKEIELIMRSIKEEVFSPWTMTDSARDLFSQMLRKSDGLTREVVVSFPNGNSLGWDAASSVYSYEDQINPKIQELGQGMHFSARGGHFKEGRFVPRSGGFTIWLARKDCSRKAVLIGIDA